MTVSEYLEFDLLTSGEDGGDSNVKVEVNEFELGKIFNLEPKDFKTLDEYRSEVEQRTRIEEDYKLPEDGQIMFNGKHWYWDKNISKTTVEQWCVVSEEISRDLKINPKLVSIYFRPVGESFNSERLPFITNELMEMDISIFLALNKVFFYQGMKLLASMRVVYLNQIQHPMVKRKLLKMWIRQRKNELIRFGKRMVGIFKRRK